MRLITCPKCNSQFDVSSMAPGTSFVCGKCRNVLEVPEAGPVLQPIAPAGGAPKGAMKPPPTVSMTPDQVRKALAESAAVGAARTKPPAPPAQQRQLPKAMQKRAQEAASQSGQRAGATSQPPAAAAPAAKGGAATPAGKAAAAAKPAAKAKSGAKASSASARSASRGSSSGGDKKKSQGPLFAAIGIAVVVIGVIAFLMTRGGGDGEAGPAGGGQETATGTEGAGGNGGSAGGGDAAATNGSASGGAAGGGGTAPAVVDPNDKIGVFLAMTPQQQRDEFARKIAGAAGSADALHELFTFFSEDRMATNSVAKEARKAAADAALRLDSKLEWANEASGKKNLRDLLVACRDECAKAFGYAEDDETKVLDRISELEDGSPWVDAPEFKEFEAVVGRIRTRETELENSPRLVQVEKQKDWIRHNDLFKDFEVIARHEEPYVVFQQYPKFGEGMERYDEQRMEKAQHLAKRDGVIFRELNNQFRNLFGARFELPKLEEKGRLLRVLILWDRKSFDEWHAKQNSGMSGLIRAYYSPAERHIVHYVGTEALTEQDFYKCANGRIQKTSDQVTFHEGTHQLMHEYAAIYRGAPLPADPEAEVEVPPRKSMWFDEGLAEFMGAVEINEGDMQDLGGEFFHNRVLLERIGLARHVRRNYPNQKWSLAKLLLPNHNGDMMQMGGEVIPSRPDLAANLFYAQSWAFVHFSWFYDNGKYRKNLLDYMERVLKNEHSPEALAKAYGLPSADDFGDIEKEYDWYYTELLRRVPGKVNNVWRTPDTDPPAGTWDPNGGGDDGDYDE